MFVAHRSKAVNRIKISFRVTSLCLCLHAMWCIGVIKWKHLYFLDSIGVASFFHSNAPEPLPTVYWCIHPASCVRGCQGRSIQLWIPEMFPKRACRTQITLCSEEECVISLSKHFCLVQNIIARCELYRGLKVKLKYFKWFLNSVCMHVCSDLFIVKNS